jgi:ATP-dependent 26S proteasome regulatory subunit
MKIGSDVALHHSENVFRKRFRILSDAGAGVIHIRTNEVQRATNILRKTVLIDGQAYREWDVVNGMRTFTVDTMYSNVAGDRTLVDIHEAMAVPGRVLQDSNHKDAPVPGMTVYYVYVNPQYWLENNPLLNHFLQYYGTVLPTYDVRVVLITPDIALPDNLSDTAVTLKFETPGHSELREAFGSIVEAASDIVTLDDQEIDRICYAGAGMTKNSFEMYASLAIVDAAEQHQKVNADQIIDGINRGKTEIVNKNDILELYPVEDINDVGGMENLKEWIAKRSRCYSDEAREFGIEAPKGLVLVGIPGSGKSLSAKAIAKEFGVPLVRLDFGRVFNSLVGKSEERIRTALSMVESMAPCVLFCDEIDKGLGGIGGSGDSGTSSRVLGSFLTWLNDNKKPVFAMVTANNVGALPPELLRRGRFDAIFATGFPTPAERLEILDIHLRKRGWDCDTFSAAEKKKVVDVAKGYVPAEIEAAVKDGLIDAFDAGEAFSMQHVANALRRMVPMSRAYSAEIQKITLWSKQNAVSASKAYDDLTTGEEAPKQRIRRLTNLRNEDDDV